MISAREFKTVPLRVHTFLNGVALHDAWAVDLPRPRSGITLAEFLDSTSMRAFSLSPATRALLRLRFFIGSIFGWDRDSGDRVRETFSSRLTAEDRAASLLPAGTADGAFRVVYRFADEQLSEISNRTAHAAALSALVESADSYRYYFAVYVRDVSPLTPLYMALIDPFRKLIVYPSLLRSIRTSWSEAFDTPYPLATSPPR